MALNPNSAGGKMYAETKSLFIINIRDDMCHDMRHIYAAYCEEDLPVKICVLFSSPRPEGNTMHLLEPVVEELERLGHTCKGFSLYKMNLKPCIACRSCQEDWSLFGCVHRDDLVEIFDEVLGSDLILLASPVYSWYCTPPLKIVLDRLVYGMNKYYGGTMGPSLWKGKSMALVTTCGYPVEKGADLLEEGLKRYCKHSGLRWQGMLAARQRNLNDPFMDEEKRKQAVAFASQLSDAICGGKENSNVSVVCTAEEE